MTATESAAVDSTCAISVRQLRHVYPARRSRWGRGAKAAASAGAAARRPAIEGLNLDVLPGEIFGILGPNGGGKSTLMRILTTLLRPTAGSVQVFGYDVLLQPELVRRTMGVVFQMPSLDGQLTAWENLMHQGHLYGLRGRELEERCTQALRLFGLEDRRDEITDHFSGGMRRRLEIGKAMLHRPRLLLMDEPSTGLDPGVRSDLWRLLLELQQQTGLTIILSTHLMDEADRCDRLAVMAQGQLMALDAPANLKARIGGDVITLTARPSAANAGDAAQRLCQQIRERFGPWDGLAEPTLVAGQIRLERRDGAAFVPTLAAALPDQIATITVGQPTLEDVFLHLTGRTLTEEEAA